MGKIALTVLGWIASKLGLLIFTLLVFIAGTYLKSEFDRHDQVLKEMQRGIQVVGDTAPDKVVKSLTNILGGELPSAQTALGEISQARAKLQAASKDKKIERDRVERDASIVELKLPVSGPSLQLLKLDVDIELLDQANRHLAAVEVRARDVSSCLRTPKVSCQNQIGPLQGEVAQQNANIVAWNTQIANMRSQNPVLEKLCTTYDGATFGSLACRQISVHQQAVAQAQDKLVQASARINFLRRAEQAANEPVSFIVDQATIDARRAMLRSYVEELETWLDKNWLEQLMSLVKTQLLYALWVVLLAILTPLLFRAAIWIGAGMGRHLSGITLFPDSNPDILVTDSSKNCRVDLTVGTELLLPIGYPLGKLDGLECDTQPIRLFLSKPLISMASGMYLLDRVITQTGGTAMLTVPENDPSASLSVVELREGSCLVLRPRYILGVIQDCGRPLTITGHYRIFSSASWLTGQFRYIVFHGPGKLILKGGHKVIVEPVQSGLESNRHLTIGYTANLKYSAIRRSGFWSFVFGYSYLGGERFAGQSGVVLSSATAITAQVNRSAKGLPPWLDSIRNVLGL
jgi:hypothetical protein